MSGMTGNRQYPQNRVFVESTIGKSRLITAPSNNQLEICEIGLAPGTAGVCGAAIRFADTSAAWNIGTIIAANTPDFTTDVTAAIQAGTSTTVITTTNNDGFLVSSHRPFNIVGMTISQADGGGATYSYAFWDGTNYTTFTPQLSPSYSSTADAWLTFLTPPSWVVGTNATVGGPSSSYNLLVRATTAGAAAVKLSAMWVSQLLHYQTSSVTTAINVWPSDGFGGSTFKCEVGDSVMGYFATANANNCVRVTYKISG